MWSKTTLTVGLLLFWSTLAPSALPAQSTQDEYNRIQRELKSHQQKLATTKKTERSLLLEMRKANAGLQEIENRLAAQKGKIRGLQKALSDTQSEIKAAEENLERHKKYLKGRLKAIQRFHFESDASLVLMSGEDFAESLRIIRYLRDISAHDDKRIAGYTQAVKVLNEKKQRLEGLYASLRHEEEKLTKLNASLHEKKKERQQLLVAVRKEKGMYEDMIRDLRESSNKLLRIIQESERREREARRKKALRDDKEEKGKQEKAEELGDENFTKLKGRLPWPVNGSLALKYGTQVDPTFNLPVFRSGIHIKAPLGSVVKAVHDGKVVFADEFKGYGQLVIVSHGSGYHTLYGNLSKILAKNGAILKDGQPVGESGESDTLGIQALYFEVRYKGKPLDPLQWLKK